MRRQFMSMGIRFRSSAGLARSQRTLGTTPNIDPPSRRKIPSLKISTSYGPTRMAAVFSTKMPLRSKRLAFLGGGTMAEAIVRGLLERHLVPPSRITVTGPRRERRAELSKQFGVRALA